MPITLTPEQEKFVQAKLKSGKYHNSEELISKAFQLLDEDEELPIIPPHIRVSESAKELLAEKIQKLRKQQEIYKNQPVDPQRQALSEEFKRLCAETQALHADCPLSDEEISAEIEAYRRGE